MVNMVNNNWYSRIFGYLCLVVLSSCATTNQTFVMPTPVTYPEERKVLIAVPVSIYALSLGYKNHKTSSFMPAGIIGLCILVLAAVLGESILGEFGEKGLTLLGSIMVAFAHYRNHQICRKLECNNCHE